MLFVQARSVKRVCPSARAFQALVEPPAAFAHPPYLPGGYAGHERIVPDIPGHHGTGGHHCTAAYGMTANYGAVHPQRRTLPDERSDICAMHREMRTRSRYVGKTHRRAAKYVVFDFDALTYYYVVLNTHPVANLDIVADIHVLPQGAVTSYRGACLHVAEVPYFRAVAHGNIIIDIARRMHEIFLVFHIGWLKQFYIALVGQLLGGVPRVEESLCMTPYEFIVHVAVCGGGNDYRIDAMNKAGR